MRALAALDFAWPRDGDGEPAARRAGGRALALGCRVVRARDAGVARIYASGSDAAVLDRMTGDLDPARLPGGVLDTLDVRLEIPGAAAGARCTAHYVVETDVDEAHEDDFNAWYDDEHLPGLAAVPGVIHAFRYRRAGGRPRYGAGYDLAIRDAFGSPAWLAVRATPWSSRVRPAFRNTTRTMYDVVLSRPQPPPAR